MVAIGRDGHFCVCLWFRREGAAWGLASQMEVRLGFSDPGRRRIRGILCMEKEGKRATY